MTSSERCGLVIDILSRTNDGRDLYQENYEIERHGRNGDGFWLKFLENATNGWINAAGERLLTIFHRQVLAGDYRYSPREFIRRFLGQL